MTISSTKGHIWKLLTTYPQNALGKVLSISLNHSRKALQSPNMSVVVYLICPKVTHAPHPCQGPTPLAVYAVDTPMHTWAFFPSKPRGSLGGDRLPPATAYSAWGCRSISIMKVTQSSPLGRVNLCGDNSNASKGTSVPECPLQRAGTALVADATFPKLLLVDLDHPPRFLSSPFNCLVEKGNLCCGWVLAMPAATGWLWMLSNAKRADWGLLRVRGGRKEEGKERKKLRTKLWKENWIFVD